MRIQIVGKMNGWGLTQDALVLRQALEPRHEVVFTDWMTPRKLVEFDANIFTELINPSFIAQARLNFALMNPEWTLASFRSYLRRMDLILCKTHDAERCFAPYGQAHYTGFTSRDLWMDRVPSKQFLHVAGGSQAKGTSSVIAAFERMPDLSLTIIGDRYVPKVLPANVICLGRVSDETLRHEMNDHAIHLCPSSYEGFGHYINEARSVGAVIITTNAAPMNELATSDFAYGVPAVHLTTQNLATHKHVGDLDEAIRNAFKLSQEARVSIGNKAREAYLREGQEFRERMKMLLP